MSEGALVLRLFRLVSLCYMYLVTYRKERASVASSFVIVGTRPCTGKQSEEKQNGADLGLGASRVSGPEEEMLLFFENEN